MEWFYADESRGQHGVAFEELPRLVASGTIREDTLVWNETLPDWKAAAEALPDLFPGYATPPLLSPAQRSDLGYPAGLGFPSQRAPVDTLAVLSLVFGILSLLACGPFLGLPGVICGHLARKRAREETLPSSNGGLSLAGLITGYIGLVFYGILFTIYIIIIVIAVNADAGTTGSPATP
jgi:hypothetical protein